MKGSIYAKEIDEEYRRRKYYENKMKKEKKDEKMDKRKS